MKNAFCRIVCGILILALVVVFIPVSASSNIVKSGDPLYQDGVYRFRNVKSGLYLGVYSTGNSNGINVIQKKYSSTDNTIKFRLHFDPAGGESFWPLSTNNGNGRVLDIKRGGKDPETGMNIQIYSRLMPKEDKSQLWYIIVASQNDRMYLSPRYNTNLAITAYGTGVGGTGTSQTSTGNVFVKTYKDGDTSQEWYMEYVGQSSAPSTLKTISQMKAKFPHKKFWNHTGSTNSNDGYTAIPCSHDHHSSACKLSGSCGCNSYESSIQCLGFVKKLSAEAYGSSYYTGGWNKKYNPGNIKESFFDGVKAGDILEIDNGGHYIMITSVNGKNLTYVNCNRFGSNKKYRCQIEWDLTITKADLLNKHVKWIAQAPYAWQ